LTVQSIQGQVSVRQTAQTRFYTAAAAGTAALAKGQQVAVIPARTDAVTASSVTIAPAGGLIVSVRSASATGRGGTGGTGTGRTRIGAGAGSRAGTGGRQSGVAGTITALGQGTLTIRTAQGPAQTLKMPSATIVYRVTAATRAQVTAGSPVAVRVATVNGTQTATDVVAAPAGTRVAIVAP
jgi:hypothetical protein